LCSAASQLCYSFVKTARLRAATAFFQRDALAIVVRESALTKRKFQDGAACNLIGLAKHFFGCPEQEEARAS
jgi:hypothetical protein